MDGRLLRIIIGLALESALVHMRNIPMLTSLYSNPDVGLVRELHDQLIDSGDHYDREVAIWLEPALEQGPLRSDPRRLVAEMRKMEFVLYALIPRSGRAQREVNMWMDYIANAAYSLEGGFWIDAKILLSRALQVSRCPPIEGLKADPGLGYEVDALQRATVSYFEEARGYPLTLRVAMDRLDAMLRVQEIMLDLMRLHYGADPWGYVEITRTPIHRMSTTIRYLMDERKELEASKLELRLAAEHLDKRLKEIVDRKVQAMLHAAKEGIKEVINAL